MYVLMRMNETGSQIVMTEIFSLAGVLNRVTLAQREEDATYKGKDFLKWKYYAAEIVPL